MKRDFYSLDSRLVQWCHGAPGFLPLVAKIYAQHPLELLATATQRAADVTWTRGLLVKVSKQFNLIGLHLSIL